jgi:predicted negative regulator of RcsB-dependent stress response
MKELELLKNLIKEIEESVSAAKILVQEATVLSEEGNSSKAEEKLKEAKKKLRHPIGGGTNGAENK